MICLGSLIYFLLLIQLQMFFPVIYVEMVRYNQERVVTQKQHQVKYKFCFDNLLANSDAKCTDCAIT